MDRRSWRGRLFPGPGAGRRGGLSFSDSAKYWPLTVVPWTSRSKRSLSTWILVGVILALGAGLYIAVQRYPDMVTITPSGSRGAAANALTPTDLEAWCADRVGPSGDQPRSRQH